MTALSPSYPSPSDARAKRHAGRGFYRDRGLPYQDKTTDRGDLHRRSEEKEARALGRALAELARQYPSFKNSLHQLRNHVLVQVKPRSVKYRAVLACLGTEPLSIEEIMEETTRLVDPRFRYQSAGVERAAVHEILLRLSEAGKAQPCNCDGGKIRLRRDGRPSGKVYWRLAPQ